MEKIYRILGKKGRITIPYEMRVPMGFRKSDVVSFERRGNSVIVTREKICDNCADKAADRAASGHGQRGGVLKGFLDSLPREAQQEALGILTANLAAQGAVEKN